MYDICFALLTSYNGLGSRIILTKKTPAAKIGTISAKDTSTRRVHFACFWNSFCPVWLIHWLWNVFYSQYILCVYSIWSSEFNNIKQLICIQNVLFCVLILKKNWQLHMFFMYVLFSWMSALLRPLFWIKVGLDSVLGFLFFFWGGGWRDPTRPVNVQS